MTNNKKTTTKKSSPKKKSPQNQASVKKQSPAKIPTAKVEIDDAASSLHKAINDDARNQIKEVSNFGSSAKKQSVLKRIFKTFFR